MTVEIGTDTPIFLFWDYLFRNFGILSLQCSIMAILAGLYTGFAENIWPLSVRSLMTEKRVTKKKLPFDKNLQQNCNKIATKVL
jgi:hypothetical protein